VFLNVPETNLASPVDLFDPTLLSNKQLLQFFGWQELHFFFDGLKLGFVFG
jgi:hypothetical protein